MTNESEDAVPPHPYGTATNKKNAEKLKNQLRGLYTTLESQRKDTDKQVTVALELKTDLHIQRVLERYAACKATRDKVTDKIAELQALGEPDGTQTMNDFQSWQNTISELEDKVNQAEIDIQKEIKAQAQVATPLGAPNDTRRPPLPKANDMLKPRELQLDDKPSVLRLFKREFQDYYDTSEMHRYPLRVQQNFFLQCVSVKLKTKLRHMIRDTTPILAFKVDGEDEADSCYKALDAIFKAQYPMVRRRQEFFNYMQGPGQKTSEYMDKIQDLFDEAEFEKLDPRDLLTYKAIQGCTEEPAKTKFVREEEPTFQKLQRIAQTIEAGNNMLKGQPAHTVVVEAQADKVGSPLAPKGRQPSNQDSSGDCSRCNGRDRSQHDHFTCKFKDAVCHRCGQTGHITNSPLCAQSKSSAKKDTSPPEGKKVEAGVFSVRLASGAVNEGDTPLRSTEVEANSTGTDEDWDGELTGFFASVSKTDKFQFSLSELIEQAKADKDYQLMVHAFMDGVRLKDLWGTHPAHQLASVWSHLSLLEEHPLLVYKEEKIVVPRACRKAVLDHLHDQHTSIKGIRDNALHYFWPGIRNDIKALCQSCGPCRRYRG